MAKRAYTVEIQPYSGYFNYVARVYDETGRQIDYSLTGTWLGARWEASKIIRKHERQLRRNQRGTTYKVTKGIDARSGKDD